MRRLSAQADELAALRSELTERRAQVRAVIEHNPHPTWVYSIRSLRILVVNQVAIRTYGWTRDELLAMTIADIRPREDVPLLLDNVARLQGRPSGVTGPWRHRRKDGGMLAVDVAFSSFPYSGELARLVTVHAAPPGRPVGDPAGFARLSPREREVFVLVAHGHTSQEIAERLGLSPKSIETYRARFMVKLALTTRAEIVQYAIAHGILVD
jgi:PAS domain S-box-containing protein